MRARPVVLAASLALLAIAPRARAAGVDPAAATPVQREQAQLRFARGKQLLQTKKYDEALNELDASLEIVASPNTRLLKARCLRDMGRLVAAYVEFGRTIVEAKELAREDTRYAKADEGATEDRAALEPKIGFVTITVQNAGEQTKLVIAGEEIRRAAWGEPAPVMPGETTVSVESPGRAPVTKTVKVGVGEKQSLTIDAGASTGAESAKSSDAEHAEASVAASSPSDRTKLRPYAYVAGGVGTAGLLTFAVFGAMANSTYDDLQRACGGKACPASKSGDISSGKSQQTIANVGLVVGVIGAVAGVTLFVISAPKNDEPPPAAAVLGPGWIGVKGAF